MQLQHVKSKRFLSLELRQAPVKDDGLRLHLDAMGAELSGITIHPRFHINTDGEKIEPGSQVKIIFRHKQELLTAAPYSSPSFGKEVAIFAASQQEFVDSHRTGSSSLKMHLYARYDANASKYITANDGWSLRYVGQCP